MKRTLAVAVLSLLFSLSALAQSGRILFDASKREMAGNADWVIDADLWNNNLPAFGTCPGTTPESNPQRYPTPAQSGITPATSDNYWTGGISAWGVALAKAGHTIETLPPGAAITYGNGSNPQDLSNYDLFIVPEPQNPFTAAEKSAILAFVNAGGGLFMVGDHETSDRDCDGWDSPNIYNDLTGATGPASTGLFGIWFRVDGLQVKGEDWFDDGVDNNVTTDPADPIIHGPFGDGSGGLGFFGATSMDINPADNPTVTAHVWRTGQAHNNLRVTFATASYGAGRVAAIGDSSPADDNTGDPGDTLYAGWDLAAGGVKNKEIHLNACHWLLNPTPDTTPPAITVGPASAPADCTAVITWTTDEGATSFVEYGLTAGYGSSASVVGYATSHSVPLTGLAVSTLYHYRVSSTDAAGNGPTVSSDGTFTTTAATPPSITLGPSVAPSGSAATVTWTTSEAATSLVNYGLTAAYGSSASVAGFAASHSVVLTGLTPETLYHYQVSSTDACGNGPVTSLDATFTTGPASLDLSGWVLKQFNSTQSFTFPPGTTIPSGGYLVLARNASRAQFEVLFPALPPAAVFVNSNANGSCADGCFPMMNGAETFELWNGAAMEDGTTIAASRYSTYRRNNPGDPAGTAGSWTQGARATADPGAGAGASSMAGVVINEMSDEDSAGAFEYEFIELYYDANSAPADTTAPAAVVDLAAMALSETQVRLSWTAPGDDDTTGTAAAYDLRYSLSPITEGNFASATSVAGVPAPMGGGAAEQFIVASLTPGTTYYFALKTSDEVPNTAVLSNVASAETLTDLTPPAAVSDLRATPLSDVSIRLDWTATGDDGTTGTALLYDMRWSTARILTDADFDAATALTGEPAPGASGAAQLMTVPGLTANTAYYFAIKVKDDAGASANWSALSNWACAVTAMTGSGSGTTHLVISQIQNNGDGGAQDEFVEIHNPTNGPVSVTGWSLQYRATTGTFIKQNLTSGSVPAGGYFLIARAQYNGSPAADFLYNQFDMSNTAGTVFLVNDQTLLTACSGASIVDKVAYGTDTNLCPETTAFTPAPTGNNSIVRKPGGGQGSGTDTDNNSADFEGLSPSVPHNSASPPATPPVSLGNVGQTLYLSGGGTTQLVWGKAYGAVSYKAYRGDTPTTLTLWQSPAQQQATESESPLAGAVFYYALRAFDGTNESAD